MAYIEWDYTIITSMVEKQGWNLPERESEEWNIKDQTLNSVELLDSPGFDFCDIKFSDKVYSCIYHSDIILFIVSGDLNRNE